MLFEISYVKFKSDALAISSQETSLVMFGRID